MTKKLHVAAPFGLKFDFDEDLLNPKCAPSLVVERERFKQRLRNYIENGEFDEQWAEYVKELRLRLAPLRPHLIELRDEETPTEVEH